MGVRYTISDIGLLSKVSKGTKRVLVTKRHDGFGTNSNVRMPTVINLYGWLAHLDLYSASQGFVSTTGEPVAVM